MNSEHVDVLVVGAGLSGIGAGHHLQDRLPGKSYAILEGRDATGGTWDLFRYPGIRSDSDMYTLGYDFRPWTDAKAIADGSSILQYIRDTAHEGGIDRHVRFGHKVVAASWSTADARWTVEAERTESGERVQMTCSFLYLCAGYYRYDEGYTPEFPGRERFRGRVIHPQHWPEDLDYAGKRVVIIGSGATAVTLVPAMAEQASHVTMLQRSPTYVVSLPAEDLIANGLRRVLPAGAAYGITRWKNVILQQATYAFSRRAPGVMKRLLTAGVKMRLPKEYDVDAHFTPTYDPWDQRLCVVPDGDLFRAIRHGQASVVTDRVATFTEGGIELESGAELEADIIVTATGLNLQAYGGIALTVDDEGVDLPERITYKGMMVEGVPNLAVATGYTNASWTLKCDLTAAYMCRLIAHMDAHGQQWCRPENTDPTIERAPMLDLTSGYVQRSIDQFPKQGSKAPWKMRMSYAHDIVALRRGEVDDGVMVFGEAAASAVATERESAAV
jgi:cation diffusion facilitator CzcD-associated flavoprotein CzcO